MGGRDYNKISNSLATQTTLRYSHNCSHISHPEPRFKDMGLMQRLTGYALSSVIPCGDSRDVICRTHEAKGRLKERRHVSPPISIRIFSNRREPLVYDYSTFTVY